MEGEWREEAIASSRGVGGTTAMAHGIISKPAKIKPGRRP